MPKNGLDALGHVAEQQLTIAHNRLSELAIDWREREALALLAMSEPCRIVLRDNIEPAEKPQRHAQGARILPFAPEGHQPVSPAAALEQQSGMHMVPDDRH